MVSSITCGELLIRTAKWLMFFSKLDETVRQPIGFLSGYCEDMGVDQDSCNSGHLAP